MILDQAVRTYLADLRPEPDEVLAEMQSHARRDGIPIVEPETGVLLGLLTRARAAKRVVEVGTAIGVSTLHIARSLPPDGVIVSFEVDEERHHHAREYLERAGVLDRADLRLEDARAGLAPVEGPFDMAFIDGVKGQYGDYFELLLPLLGERAVLAVDNVLMSGAAAEGRGDGHWTDEQIATVRELTRRVTSLEDFDSLVTPVGDGVLLAVRG